jgi:membrane-associated phospholipid phosphatase
VAITRVRPSGWWFDALLVAALAALTWALAEGWFLDADLAVRDWVDAHRPAPAYWIAVVLNKLGQGGQVLVPVSGLLAIAVALRARVTWPLAPVVAALLITAVTIGPLKFWLDRGYPHNWELAHPEELFSDPVGGTAYPSGHVANAIVWYGVMALLLRALLTAYDRPPPRPAVDRLIRVLPVVIVFCSTTYLGFHWITDSVAGLLLGLSLDRLLARVSWADLPLPRLPGWVRLPGRVRAPGRLRARRRRA